MKVVVGKKEIGEGGHRKLTGQKIEVALHYRNTFDIHGSNLLLHVRL